MPLTASPPQQDTCRLDLAFCTNCSLLQTLQTISPAQLYNETFSLYSSSIPGEEERRKLQADRLIAARGLDADSLVIEVGSNDGYLLRHLIAESIPVLGIEPAPRQAHAARRTGVPTLSAFFGLEIADYLRQEARAADVIVVNNLLGKVPDLHGFLGGLRLLLQDDGIVSIETPYVRSLVEGRAFSAIKHGQMSYWGAWSLDQMARSAGLFLNHVELLPTHPGTLRYQLGKSDDPSAAVLRYLRDELASGLTNFAYYHDFRREAEAISETIVARSRANRGRSLHFATATALGPSLRI
jgi:SAM-dependent methyltransferase